MPMFKSLGIDSTTKDKIKTIGNNKKNKKALFSK